MATSASNTRFTYLYRDASNWKQAGSAVFAGAITAEERETVRAGLDEGQYFIPPQVGLPDLQALFGAWTDDDHCWHEIDDDTDFTPTALPPTEPEDIHAFCARFVGVVWEEHSRASE